MCHCFDMEGYRYTHLHLRTKKYNSKYSINTCISVMKYDFENWHLYSYHQYSLDSASREYSYKHTTQLYWYMSHCFDMETFCIHRHLKVDENTDLFFKWPTQSINSIVLQITVILNDYKTKKLWKKYYWRVPFSQWSPNHPLSHKHS